MQSVAALLARKNTKLSAREVKGKQSRTKDTSKEVRVQWVISRLPDKHDSDIHCLHRAAVWDWRMIVQLEDQNQQQHHTEPDRV